MSKIAVFFAAAGFFCAAFGGVIPQKYGDDALSKWVDKFNSEDTPPYVWEKSVYPNSEAKAFLLENAPRFDCPDEDLVGTYWFRWWTFRKHITKSDRGFLITEFLEKVKWSGKNNEISCAAAHHIADGRWLKNEKIASDYITYWSDLKRTRHYSFWYADSVKQFLLARGGSEDFIKGLYPKLKKNLSAWESERYDALEGAFWIEDWKDGMEISISGALHMKWQGYRPTINSYMYAENRALADFAGKLGLNEDAKKFQSNAEKLKRYVNESLWDEKARFYKVRPKNGRGRPLSHTREQLGFTPWYFGIPPEGREDAWLQIKDEKGFKAPYGLTTAERRSPFFQVSYIGHECQWNGPVWPYSTSMTLSALANLLNDYTPQKSVSKEDFYDALLTYAKSHRRVLDSGKTVFWIDENQDPFTGEWISRKMLSEWDNGNWDQKTFGVGLERGKDYNHSTFADLIITGLVGVRLGESLDSDDITINPIVPNGWDYFCLDSLPVRGRELCIMWDRDGSRYGKGPGFKIFLDGKIAFESGEISKVKIKVGPALKR